MGRSATSNKSGMSGWRICYLPVFLLFAFWVVPVTAGPRVINGIEYVPLSGLVSKLGGRCWYVSTGDGESRFIAVIRTGDSVGSEYTFLPESNQVIHSGKKMKLPLAMIFEKKPSPQLYLPAVVAAAIFPELDVPVLNTVESDRKKDTLIVRLLLNPLQKKIGPLLYHREKVSALEFRLSIGCRVDSGFVQQLQLFVLTGTHTPLNGVKIDTTTPTTRLIWSFRQPVAETIVPLPNGLEVRIFPQLRRRIKRILLDPGHGGKDPGALGRRGTREKDIVLDISQRVKSALLKKGFEVYLTREDDRYVSLAERAAQAAKSGAQIFVSIHANWAENKAARGIETYFLSEAKTDWERAVAARENAVFEREIANPFLKKDDQLSIILADLAQNEFLFESSELAAKIQEAAIGFVHANDRGVRQANFYVLRNIFMPAVLVECGYLSNRGEEGLLLKTEYRAKLARAIADGVANFAVEYERRLNGGQ